MINTRESLKSAYVIMDIRAQPFDKSKNIMLLSEKLKWIFDEKRTNATKVAQAINVAPSTIYSIIQKNDADTKVLRKISNLFGVELPWWVDEKSDENPFNSTSIVNSNFIGSGSHNNTTNLNTSSTQEDAQQKLDLLLEKNKNGHLKSLLSEKDKLLEEKDKLLKEKDKTILSQEKTIAILQETMTMINNRK